MTFKPIDRYLLMLHAGRPVFLSLVFKGRVGVIVSRAIPYQQVVWVWMKLRW